MQMLAWARYSNAWLYLTVLYEGFMKHKVLIDKLTLEEKAAFLSGKTVWQAWDFERLGIPAIFCSDGPHGIRSIGKLRK